MPAAKSLREQAGSTLRDKAKYGDVEEKAIAVGELQRRRGNLRGAVIPEWEKAERGPDFTEWEVVR